MNFRNSYRPGMLERRAARRIELREQIGWRAYLQLLEEEPGEVAALYRDLFIGVTEFFRDPEVWAHLESQVIPALLAQRQGDHSAIKMWVPACATGEEAYSLAILFLEQMERVGRPLKVQILASDVADHALAIARRGLYPPTIQANVSPARLSGFFRQEGEKFEVRRNLRTTVTFTTHNLLADPPFSRLDLISCRNLLIDLEPHAQQRAFELFHFALKPGGLLLLGHSETAGRHADLFRAVAGGTGIFESTATSEAARHRGLEWHRGRASFSVPSGAPGDPASGPQVGRMIEQIVLSRHTGACVVVSESFAIQSVFGPTHDYLVQPTGEVRMDLLAWAKPGLYSSLRSALEWATEHRQRIDVSDMHVERDGRTCRVECTIEPISPVRGKPPLFLVAFRDIVHAPTRAETAASTSGAPPVDELEAEVKSLRQELHEAVEQLESANEGYRASHEEMVSLNDELQSNNEQLEASKEELQTLNEEMLTINRQLEERNSELRSVNTDLNNLLTSTHIPIIFLDRELRVRRYTLAATELVRLTSSDLGRSIEHIKDRFRDGNLVGDARKVLENLVPLTTELQTEHGRWFLRTVLPYRTEEDRIEGVCVAFHDITDRKRAGQEVDEARIFAEAIVATVQTALVVLDHDFCVKSANEHFYETFRVSRAETEGVSLFQLGNRQWNSSHLRELLERVVQDEVVKNYQIEHDFERIGRRIMRLDARVLRRAARPSLILLSIEDITEHRKAAHLAEMRRNELVEEHHRKDEFLAMLGHELRNPLSALIHGLDLLKVDGGQPSRVEEVRSMMARQAHRIGSMLDQLLDVARLNAGKLQVARDQVVLADAVRGAIEAVMPLIEERKQALTVSMPSGENVVVRGDLMRLTQVVENLLSNSAKYTQEGGQIELVVESSDGHAQLRVRDNGIGMDPEFVPHVFELFVQEPRTLERASGGLGLGLALVKLAVELHGGEVVASSRGIGHGSQFVVTLPRELQAEPAEQLPAPATQPPTVRRRILVVDDERDTANALAELLQIAGHESRVAHDGPEAVDAVRAFHPDVVLLDLGLPRMDGYEVAERLRRDRSNDQVLLVALTGYREDAARIKEAGFDRYLIKPPDLRKLLAWLGAPESGRRSMSA